MTKKIKCPKCNGGFMPTMDAFTLGKANCPACGTEIPVTAAQASALPNVGGVWRTINGTHIFIKHGETEEQAISRTMKGGKSAQYERVSKTAHEASVHANHDGTQEAHDHAASMHSLAAKYTKGNEEDRSFHEAASKHHRHIAVNLMLHGKASEFLTEDYCARARFAVGEPIQLQGQSGTDFDIQWMPPGEQTPVATVNGEAREMKFTVKPQHAQAFDAMLQRLRSLAAAGEGDLPLIDFNHDDGAASGRPTQFYWGGEDPKKGGIRLKGKWTASGKAAVTGDAPEFSRFSPEWYFDDNDEPLAIGVNLGGLVNRAAFKTIASVKAGAATNNSKKNMDKNEMKALLDEALKPINTEIAALKAQAKGTEQDPSKLDETALTKAIAKALEPVTQKITDMETAGKNALKAQAKAAVQLHVQRGAILPDEKLPDGTSAVEFYEGLYLANASNAEAMLKKLPGKSLGRVIVGAGNGGTATAGAAEFSPQENQILAGARKLRVANKAIASDAQAIEMYLRTPEGSAVYQELHQERVQQARARGK